MLGIGGKFAGAKGMVAVPNLSGLSTEAALSSLQNSGLVRGSVGTGTTSDSALENKVFSQSIPAGTLVDYETVVNYSFNLFVPPVILPPPPPPPPTEPPPVIPDETLTIEYFIATSQTSTELKFYGGTFSSYRITYMVNGNPSNPANVVFGPINLGGGTVTVGGALTGITCGTTYQAKVDVFSGTNGTGSVRTATSSSATTNACSVSPVPCGSSYWVETSRSFDCSDGGGFSRTRVNEELRQNLCLSGVLTGQFTVLDRRSTLLNDRAQRDGVCGYVTPVVTCSPTFSVVSTWTGSCINGSQLWATRYRNSCTGEEHVVSGSFSCCISTQIVVSSWTGSCINCYRQTAVRYRDSCTGQETVINGYEYCCSTAPASTSTTSTTSTTTTTTTSTGSTGGGPSGGGAGGQIAL